MDECEKFLQSIEDTKWVVKNHDSIVKDYQGEFIAVRKCRIVAHHKDIDTLMDIIEAKYPDDLEYITTEFITSKEITVIL